MRRELSRRLVALQRFHQKLPPVSPGFPPATDGRMARQLSWNQSLWYSCEFLLDRQTWIRTMVIAKALDRSSLESGVYHVGKTLLSAGWQMIHPQEASVGVPADYTGVIPPLSPACVHVCVRKVAGGDQEIVWGSEV